MQLSSGEIITFHDKNSFTKTGVSLEIADSTWEQINNISYSKSFENRVYAESAEIPLLKKALDSICSINNQTSLWFDIKYAFGIEYMLRLLDDLENSPCACDAGKKLVFEVFKDLSAVMQFKSLMNNRRCKLLAAMSLYDFQIPNGFDSLRILIGNYAGYVDVVDFPSGMVRKFPELLKDNYENGVCNSVYGEYKSEIQQVANSPYLDVVIFDFYSKVLF